MLNRLVTLFFYFLFCTSFFAQINHGLNIEDLRYSNGNVDVNQIYNVVEQPPTFPGGEAALLKYVATHIKYPENALKDSIQGVVNLRFVVEADGSVGGVQVAKSLREDCDKEAVRVVKSLPRFISAKQQGQAVRVWFSMPVRFQIIPQQPIVPKNSPQQPIVPTLSQPSGSYGGHDYVDLGLPSGTLWATTNVGADNPEDYGDYFAWGETEPKKTYNWKSYKWMQKRYSDWRGCNKYTVADGQTNVCWYNKKNFIGDNKTELDFEDDVAYVNWGEGWCMPSLQQIQELCDDNFTTTQWITQEGKTGRLITSKSNGASIFLPAAGFRFDGTLGYAGSGGYYWSRSLDANNSGYANFLIFLLDIVGYSNDFRYCGRPIRPVRVSASE